MGGLLLLCRTQRGLPGRDWRLNQPWVQMPGLITAWHMRSISKAGKPRFEMLPTRRRYTKVPKTCKNTLRNMHNTLRTLCWTLNLSYSFWLSSASEVGIDWKMQSGSSKSEAVHGQRRQTLRVASLNGRPYICCKTRNFPDIRSAGTTPIPVHTLLVAPCPTASRLEHSSAVLMTLPEFVRNAPFTEGIAKEETLMTA